MTPLRSLGAFAACVVLWGCGGPADVPDLGEVSGYVKLDGQPVQGAKVTFQPETGRPSTAFTDAEGNYELAYSRGESGAKVGKHTVRISTLVVADDEQPGVPEKIPEQYNKKTELTKDVEGGDNEINFDLKSK